MPPIPKLLRRILRTAVLTYLGVCLVVYFIQDSIIFPGAFSQGKAEAVVAPLPGCDLVQLISSKGDKIVAMYGRALMSDDSPDPNSADDLTVAYFYGNGATIAWCLGEFDQFRRLGVNVIMPDYAGYGMSGGKASEASVYATADAVYDYLINEKHLAGRRIVSVGWSMGGAVAIDLASRRAVGGLATFNAYTSLPDMAQQLIPWIPSPLIVKYRFDNLNKIAAIHCPTFICNGVQDELVAPEMSDRLAAAAAGKVTRLKVPSASHNTIFTADPDRVFTAFGEFLKEVGQRN